MRRLMVLVLFLPLLAAQAQQSKPLQFREEMFDFGSIKEEGGPVMHEFVFTNTTTRTIKILDVQASCGCTTPAWTKDGIASGRTGFIQASYNPKGRPGFFNKTLTVTTDFDPTPLVLQIKGQVETVKLEPEYDFHVANGNIKLKSASLNLGKVYRKDEYITRDFAFLNTGTKPITYNGKYVSPAHIKVDVQPRTIAPGARGAIKIGYNGKLKDQYGFQTDNVQITTDDESNPVKSFSVFATLEDYFPPLSPDEAGKTPQLRLSASTLDMGRFNQNATVMREVVVTNTGKKELLIRSLQGNCKCITAKADKNALKAGDSSKIQITFSPQERKGTHQKALTIYSNDPMNPVQRVTLTAYIE